jgi:hypothetical protein
MRWLGMAVIQTLTGESIEVEEKTPEEESLEMCDIKCLMAIHDKCRCRCHGRNHGYLVKKKNAKLDDFETYLYLSHIEEIAKLFWGKKCPSCGDDLSSAEVLGYEHPDGIYVENYGMKLWVFARCPKCGFDISFKKVI